MAATNEAVRTADLKHRAFAAKIKDVDKKNKTVKAYVSTIVKDSYDEVVLPDFDLTRYLKNPVVLWAHNYDMPPIGRAQWLKPDKTGLLAQTEFAKSQIAEDVFNLYADGFLKAFSIGYFPKSRIHPGDDEWGDLIEQWQFDASAREIHLNNELFEYSAVPVPANPDAVTEMIKAVKSDNLKSYFLDLNKECGCEKGERLAALLNRLIDNLVTDERSRADIVEAMGEAAGISSGTVNQILQGNINCPPLNRLRGFARVLSTSLARLRGAAENDGCEYDSENALMIEELRKLNERLDKIEQNQAERKNIYQEILLLEKTLKEKYKSKPVKHLGQAVGLKELRARIPKLVDGACRDLKGKLSD